MTLVLLFLSAFLAGAINSVAGGGTLLTFPALLSAGVPPIAANATSTVALVPGSLSAFWGYRAEMGESRRELLAFGIPSVIGGIGGALVVDRVGDRTFSRLVPWLIFGATLLFAVQPIVRRGLERLRASHDRRAARNGEPKGLGARAPLAFVFQLLVAFYGGFFGAGIGILMLAAMGLMGLRSIHRMNGLKNFAAVCINGVAAITFVVLGRVRWPLALLMAVGAIAGGYGGAGLARRLGERSVRGAVVGIGVTIGVAMLIRAR